MGEKQQQGLSTAEKELLGVYRSSLSPAPARKARAWAALGSLAEIGAGTAAAGTTKLIVLSALTTATVLGGAGAWVAREDSPTEASRPDEGQLRGEGQPSSQPRLQKEDSARPVAPDPVPQVIKTPPSQRLPEKPTSRSLPAIRTRRSSVSTPKALKAAARSLKRMRATLSAGHNAQVLGLVRAHRLEFESAVFAEEVDALEVMASCRRSPDASAQKLLESFVSRFPASPQGPALRRTCQPAPVPLQRPSMTGSTKEEK